MDYMAVPGYGLISSTQSIEEDAVSSEKHVEFSCSLVAQSCTDRLSSDIICFYDIL